MVLQTSLVSLQPAKNWKVHLWDVVEGEIVIIDEQLTDMQQLRDVIMSIWPKTWRIEAALKTNGAPTFHCPAVPDKVAGERILWDQFKPTSFVSRGVTFNCLTFILLQLNTLEVKICVNDQVHSSISPSVTSEQLINQISPALFAQGLNILV